MESMKNKKRRKQLSRENMQMLFPIELIFNSFLIGFIRCYFTSLVWPLSKLHCLGFPPLLVVSAFITAATLKAQRITVDGYSTLAQVSVHSTVAKRAPSHPCSHHEPPETPEAGWLYEQNEKLKNKNKKGPSKGA